MNFFKILLTMLVLTLTLSANISIAEKKENFRKLIIPAIDKVYNELQTQYTEVLHYISKSDHYKTKIEELKKLYKVKTDEELLLRLKPHPRSIAIAQAAIESAWATSRFFRKANNIFGVWSFNKNDSRIAAGEQRGSKTIWLRKYDTIEDSVRDYYRTLARTRAYKEFRELKMKTDDPYKLVKKLDSYSELGAKYGEKLSSMIRYNKFYLYDKS